MKEFLRYILLLFFVMMFGFVTYLAGGWILYLIYSITVLFAVVSYVLR